MLLLKLFIAVSIIVLTKQETYWNYFSSDELKIESKLSKTNLKSFSKYKNTGLLIKYTLYGLCARDMDRKVSEGQNITCSKFLIFS